MGTGGVDPVIFQRYFQWPRNYQKIKHRLLKWKRIFQPSTHDRVAPVPVVWWNSLTCHRKEQWWSPPLDTFAWLVVDLPNWKMLGKMGRMTSHILWTNKNMFQTTNQFAIRSVPMVLGYFGYFEFGELMWEKLEGPNSPLNSSTVTPVWIRTYLYYHICQDRKAYMIYQVGIPFIIMFLLVIQGLVAPRFVNQWGKTWPCNYSTANMAILVVYHIPFPNKAKQIQIYLVGGFNHLEIKT